MERSEQTCQIEIAGRGRVQKMLESVIARIERTGQTCQIVTWASGRVQQRPVSITASIKRTGLITRY